MADISIISKVMSAYSRKKKSIIFTSFMLVTSIHID